MTGNTADEIEHTIDTTWIGPGEWEAVCSCGSYKSAPGAKGRVAANGRAHARMALNPLRPPRREPT